MPQNDSNNTPAQSDPEPEPAQESVSLAPQSTEEDQPADETLLEGTSDIRPVADASNDVSNDGDDGAEVGMDTQE